jgi:hypothetical protein
MGIAAPPGLCCNDRAVAASGVARPSIDDLCPHPAGPP